MKHLRGNCLVSNVFARIVGLLILFGGTILSFPPPFSHCRKPDAAVEMDEMMAAMVLTSLSCSPVVQSPPKNDASISSKFDIKGPLMAVWHSVPKQNWFSA